VHGEAEYADYAVPRKLCHSFSELQHQQRHHQRYQRHDEAEYANYAEQKKKFHDIDIAGELLRKSSEGIAEVDEAMLGRLLAVAVSACQAGFSVRLRLRGGNDLEAKLPTSWRRRP